MPPDSNKNTDELITSIHDGHICRTVQNAAYVLDMLQQMPKPSPDEVYWICMVQALHDANNGGGYPPPCQVPTPMNPATAVKVSLLCLIVYFMDTI